MSVFLAEFTFNFVPFLSLYYFAIIYSKWAPYFWVKDVSKDTILMGVTDPNKDLSSVKGYTVYYWGHRFGAESTIE